MNQYEAMFLFDPTFGGSFENCETEIRRLMERAQAEIVFCRKWDERRLAYRIKGRKRGVYVLVYFKAASDRIAGLERDAKLSEAILRVLILRVDDLTLDDMERICPVRREEAAKGDSGRVVETKASEPSKVEPTLETATDTAVLDAPEDVTVESE